MAVKVNPWGAPGQVQNQDSSVVRAGKSGDVGLGGIQTVLGTAPPQVDPNMANLGYMGVRSALAAKFAADRGLAYDPATGNAQSGLSNTDMDTYLRASGSMLPQVGLQFDSTGAFDASRTADNMGAQAFTRGFNPLEQTADPSADPGQMLAQRAYLRDVAGGATTAAQSQLAAGLRSAQAGQASLASGMRGAQAAAARRSSAEAQLGIKDQGRGQMATQQASDVQSAQGQLQGMNQAISQGLGQRQDMLAAGQGADATFAIQNQAAQQDALRAQLANLATRNDLTAEQKQQMLQAWQSRTQADRLQSTYGLRGLQMTANRDLNAVNQATGQANAGGQVVDRVNMARFEDATQRGAAAMGAIGAGAGMAIRGMSGGPVAASNGNMYAGADASATNKNYGGYA